MNVSFVPGCLLFHTNVFYAQLTGLNMNSMRCNQVYFVPGYLLLHNKVYHAQLTVYKWLEYEFNSIQSSLSCSRILLTDTIAYG